MPFYEFQCECGEKFEKMLPVDQRNEGHCPKCGKLAERLLSVFGFKIDLGKPPWANQWQDGKPV